MRRVYIKTISILTIIAISLLLAKLLFHLLKIKMLITVVTFRKSRK